MGTRNYSLGSRDMKIAGYLALKRCVESESSIATMASKWNTFVDYIREEHGIRRLEHITQELLLMYGTSLAEKVEDDSSALSTAHDYLSVVNTVMAEARKDNLVWASAVHDCGIPRRSGIATENLAVSEEDHLAWLTSVDPRLAVMMNTERHFGLRFEESAKLDAGIALKKSSSGWIDIRYGTKGGQKRRVPVLTEEQQEVLEQAAKIQGKDLSLIPSCMSYAKFRRMCYRIAAKLGIRFHRERHTYAQVRYKTVVGADCPVVAQIKHGRPHIAWLAETLGISYEVARKLDAESRLSIAEELGHHRKVITNAYFG